MEGLYDNTSNPRNGIVLMRLVKLIPRSIAHSAAMGDGVVA